MDKEQKKENEQKKEYLKQYSVHVRRVRRINDEIRELRSMRVNPSVKQSDGMPHGNGSVDDLSSYAAELDRMIRELQQERYFRIKSYQQIVNQIKKMKNENEKDVLFYRYIRGLDWWEIAEKMRYGERHIYKIHGKALINFKIPKEGIEWQ